VKVSPEKNLNRNFVVRADLMCQEFTGLYFLQLEENSGLH